MIASSSQALSDHDITRIAELLSSGLSKQPVIGANRYFDVVLGFVVAITALSVIWYYFKGAVYRQLMRTEQSFAVEALKNVDKKTLKEVLGDVDLPSWITFPDFERVGWVNDTIDQLWPYVNDAVSVTMREQLNPLLAENKPGWMSSIKLYRFDLGDKPPQVNGMKVYKNQAVKDQVIIEADFVWAGANDVQLVVKPIPKTLGGIEAVGKAVGNLISLRVGTQKLIVTGRIRLSLKPLIDDLPIVGAIHVAFVEVPKFSLNLTLYGGDISFLPGLEAWLTAFVKDNVLRPFVLPQAFVYPLVDSAHLGIEKPEGMVFVKLIEATNVPRMDLFSDSDPYVKMFVRDKRIQKSQVKENSKNPKWNEDFKFLVHEPDYQALNAIMFDWDRVNADDEIGRISVPIKDLPHAEPQDLWLEIFDYAADDEANKVVEDEHIINGLFGTVRNVKNLTTAAISRFERHVPLPERNKKCKLHMEVTYYKFQAQELRAAEMDETKTEDDCASGDETAAEDQHLKLSKEVVNTLKGGVLYVKPVQASHVMHKPWFKGGVLGSTTTCKVSVAGQSKHTITGHGPDPIFTEPLEFLLGGDDISVEHSEITIELWDYRLRDSFQGSLKIRLAEIIDKQRIKERYTLDGVRHGELILEMQWISAVASH
ncbi:hypothetical protein WJX73_005591 [Symbiochloris irregularis]|uniref:Plant synaptotagmin n=1 Tax=Symbiochloris irregularis TaxID=706552 RepID=A0AAW1PC86_9CHLO